MATLFDRATAPQEKREDVQGRGLVGFVCGVAAGFFFGACLIGIHYESNEGLPTGNGSLYLGHTYTVEMADPPFYLISRQADGNKETRFYHLEDVRLKKGDVLKRREGKLVVDDSGLTQ